MMRKVFSATLLSLAINHGQGQMGCMETFGEIFDNEIDRDPSQPATYELCENTLIEPGKIDPQTGMLEFGDTPLTLRANAHVKCGPDGGSAGNCTVDGSGSFAIFVVPHVNWGAMAIGNITFEGLTFSFWTLEGQRPILISGTDGSVTFKDCIFENNVADPLFVLDQVDFTIQPPPGPSSPNQRSLVNSRASTNTPYYWCYGPECENRHRWLQSAPQVDSRDDSSITSERKLQEEIVMSYTFDGCKFADNSPVKQARSQNGLALVSMRRSDPMGSLNELASKNTKFVFINNEFVGNNFNIQDDDAGYRAIIDHRSIGDLIMKNNCFVDSTARSYGLVLKQRQAKLINENNYLDEKQVGLDCPFVANVYENYTLARCGGQAKAVDCGEVEAPAPAPTDGGGFFGCFSADATCEVKGMGQVLMRDISLGDKVLVDTHKYEPVYSFGHRSPFMETIFLRISTVSHQLVITGDHMVFLENGESVPASHVQINDKLQLAENESELVTDIETIKKRGAYAPFTASGTIIINGVKTSTFVAFQDSKTLVLSGVDTSISFQFIAHTFELPHRLWCHYLSDCLEEHYTADGISTWVALPHTFSLWFLKQNDFVTIVLAVPFLLFLGILGNLHAVLLAMIATATIFTISRSRLSFSVKMT